MIPISLSMAVRVAARRKPQSRGPKPKRFDKLPGQFNPKLWMLCKAKSRR